MMTEREKMLAGELYDAFRLNKRPGEINELVDEIPNTPERLGEYVLVDFVGRRTNRVS